MLLVYDTYSGNVNLKAYVDFYKTNLETEYGVQQDEIEAEACDIANHDNCYFLTWNYVKDNHDYVGAGYIIYEESNILCLIEAGYRVKQEVMEAELLEMAKTVTYTDDYYLPSKEEYPITIENPYTRVTF